MGRYLDKIICILIMAIFLSIPVNADEFEYTVDINKTYQKIEGFGASIAWYENFLTEHPNKELLYDVIFEELGLDILRLQNWYGKRSPLGEYVEEIVENAEKSLGYPVKILISSWTPPPGLKSNNDPENGGTLIKENGEYAYDKFAEYWYESLQAYERVGITADYISIQNEPDYEAEWNSCFFAPAETDELAGYDKALAAVYAKLHQEMENPPDLLGPETVGIGYIKFYKYLEEMNLDYIYAIAHHLYRGGDHTNPASFSYHLRQLADKYRDIPKFQTEYERGDDGFKTAWLIHNSLVEENVSAYLYWDLIWDNGGLIAVENPYLETQWRTEKGFYKSEEYYSLQHYAKYIKPGFIRVDISGKNNKIKVSAYLSPDKNELVIVGINTHMVEEEIKLSIPGFKFKDSEIYKSDFIKDNARYVKEGPLNDKNTIILPAHSVVTVRLSK